MCHSKIVRIVTFGVCDCPERAAQRVGRMETDQIVDRTLAAAREAQRQINNVQTLMEQWRSERR